ncbi:MAG TPA: di-heme oxidoredictase family protein [Vicinamibacterales bacterium]|jgi:CxxC motif-containing protein (DUF1111 family)|nr:di-heme oxidoredictase family protein [Vicinamibacterales bacterium]
MTKRERVGTNGERLRVRTAVGLTALSLLGTVAIVAAQGPGLPGAPLAGLTPREFEEFRLGLDDFLEVETAEEGLGPAFNGTSCAACHSVPAVGGGGLVTEVRAGRRLPSGEFQPIDESGESLFQLFSVPGHACQPVIPASANVIARRVPVPLFGAGLIEAIEDSTLLDLEDPSDRDRDDISGRAAVIVDRATGDRRVGRFGWKAQHATLLVFGADAYRNEMGITNAIFASELAFGVDVARMRLCDPIPDPEDAVDPRTGRRGIDNFASFMKFLAPVPRQSADDSMRRGESIFGALGCASCHVPSLPTGPSVSPPLHRRPVALFSDLLLHDVGTGDGIPQGAAQPNEFRTPALWGLRFRRPLLHDGSAATAEEAILRHRGEAERVRAAYQRLGQEDRAALLWFLSSL